MGKSMKIKELVEGTDPLEDRIDQLTSDLMGLADEIDLDDDLQAKLKDLETDLQIYRDIEKEDQIDVKDKVDQVYGKIKQIKKEIAQKSSK